MNHFLQHIPFHHLVDFVEGHLPPYEREKLVLHFTNCDACSREMSQLKRLLGLMRTDTSEDSPSGVISRVLSLFPSTQESTSPLSDPYRHILALVQFDSKGLLPAFGVRSGEPGARQLLFDAETYHIDLRIEADGQEWIVSGQVLGDVIEEGEVTLQSIAASRTRVAVLNSQREFTLPSIEAGQYRLAFHLPDIVIEVDDLKVGI